MLEGLLEYLATLEGVPAPGQGLFIGRMPQNPALAAVVMQTGGMAPERTQESTGLGVQKVTMQIITRGPQYKEAHDLANAMAHGCGGVVNLQLGAEFWLSLLPEHPPIYSGPDMMERPQFFVNLVGLVRDD